MARHKPIKGNNPLVTMKRLLLIISTILTLTACSNEGDSQLHDRAISFSNVSTRADVSNLQADGFYVWAGMKANGETTYTPILTEEWVRYDATNGWYYTNTRYWLDNYDFSFVACYPYDESRYTFDAANNSITLAVAETPSETDYLMATHVVDTSMEGFNPNNPVSLTFSHMLTQVSLKIWREGGKHANDQMRITNVTLSNLAKAGSYSSAANSWTSDNSKLNLKYRQYRSSTGEGGLFAIRRCCSRPIWRNEAHASDSEQCGT